MDAVILMTLAALSFSIDATPQATLDRGADAGVGALSFGGGGTGNGTGYDALNPQGKRKTPQQVIAREDVHLKGIQRTRLSATARDIVRNFSVAAWAVRRHLDYVARFSFQPMTKDSGLNQELRDMIEIQSKPTEFDVGTRCTREKYFRICEARRVVDGDVGTLFTTSGAVQGIESDLIKNPPDDRIDKRSSAEWVDGVEIDSVGSPRRYSLYGRAKGGQSLVYRNNVRAANFHLHGFFDRFATEQVRGVSPIVTGLNPFRDVYEGFDYALAKLKISQLLAVALMREANVAPLTNDFPDPDAEAEGDVAALEARKPREFDFSKGVLFTDLDIGEKLEIVESRTPSEEFQSFTSMMLMVGLKALDIPFSFYDESHTNYSGQRNAWLLYERASLDKRDDQLEMRRRWTLWQFQRWILSGMLRLPRGMTIADLKFQWVPLGFAWWKPSEELAADLKAMAAGLKHPQQVADEHALGNVEDNVRQLAAFFKMCDDIGQQVIGRPLPISFDAGPFLPEVPEPPAKA